MILELIPMYKLVSEVHVCMYIGHLNRIPFIKTRVALSVEHQTSNLRVVGSSTTKGKIFLILYLVAFDAILAGTTGPIQMKSIKPFIGGIQVYRENDHLKEKWRRY